MNDEVNDFLDRQWQVVEAMTKAAIAARAYSDYCISKYQRASTLMLKALDAHLAKNKANELIAEYERSRG